MAKSVYSLVLADDVVAAIDEMAARTGRNRSSLVNHILAEYACLTTQEKRNGQVLASLLDAMDADENRLRVSGQSNQALTLKTALSYKYNPALAYTVEVRGQGAQLGSLRLSLRSQNSTVLENFSEFLQLWDNMEASYLPSRPNGVVKEEKRYSRALRRPDIEEAAAGQAVAGYVSLLDDCLKTFFQNLNDLDMAFRLTEMTYKKRLKSDKNISLL